MKTEVTIKLKIKNKEIELSLQELKELRQTLNDLIEIVEKKEYIPYPFYPYIPYWPYRDYKEWKIIWSDNTGFIDLEPKVIDTLNKHFF